MADQAAGRALIAAPGTVRGGVTDEQCAAEEQQAEAEDGDRAPEARRGG
jgi:hypothetical protein